MGLWLDGDDLYVADAETSAIRLVPAGGAGTVRTLVGKGLFDFGDRDGPADAALLQHPQGVAAAAGTVFIADTYNGKIRSLDLRSNTLQTRIEHLREPGQLWLDGRSLLIADSGNHRILRAQTPGGALETVCG